MNALLLCLSHASTRLFGLDRTVNFFRWLGQFVRRRPSDATAGALADRVLGGMQFLPLRIECLDQAIATWFVLNCHGYEAILQIGMKLSPLSGHAWVTCDAQTFIQTPGMEDFTTVASYPPFAQTA